MEYWCEDLSRTNTIMKATTKITITVLKAATVLKGYSVLWDGSLIFSCQTFGGGHGLIFGQVGHEHTVVEALVSRESLVGSFVGKGVGHTTTGHSTACSVGICGHSIFGHSVGVLHSTLGHSIGCCVVAQVTFGHGAVEEGEIGHVTFGHGGISTIGHSIFGHSMVPFVGQTIGGHSLTDGTVGHGSIFGHLVVVGAFVLIVQTGHGGHSVATGNVCGSDVRQGVTSGHVGISQGGHSSVGHCVTSVSLGHSGHFTSASLAGSVPGPRTR